METKFPLRIACDPLARESCSHCHLLTQQAHALTPFLTASPVTDSPTPEFPFLTLLLSGGHTLLLLARSISSFSILATTHDESIGASIDKVARDLEIPWALGAGSPGAALERFAFPNGLAGGSGPGSDLEEESADLPPAPTFTQPFARRLAFSYAGLRSALTRLLEAEPSAKMAEARKRQIARAFSLAAFKQIEDKVVFALEKMREEGHEPVRGLVVSGGVASNLILRERCVRALAPSAPVSCPRVAQLDDAETNGTART
jgi:N6-L-threonylcarbamoyladenine synthase